MKPFAILLLLTAAAGADDLIPQPFPKDRYADTIGKSPFVLETKVVETAAPPINPFQNLYLRLVSKDENGKDYVLVQRLGEERSMRFTGTEPGPDEISIKSVRNGSSFRETKVVLQKGSDTGEIGFKEDTINAPPPAAAAPRGPGLPGTNQKPGGGMPFPPVNAPRTQQVAPPSQPVPRPGGTGAMPMPVQQPQPVVIPQIPGSANRPRIRNSIINN